MSKLTKYKSFEELKLNGQSTHASSTESSENVLALKVFLERLKNEIYVKKKTKKR